MSNNIKVLIKVRPLLQKEKDANLQVQWNFNNYSVTRTAHQSTKRKRSNIDKFYFDHVFNEHNTNQQVFERDVQKMVNLFLCGYNQNVITYGEQNSGKTYTMTGTENDSGIIPLAIKYMFERATNLDNQKFVFKVSCFEVYNDTINDLINTNRTNLKLMECLNGVVQVVGCKEELVTSADGLLNILNICQENRKIYNSDVCKRNDKSHVVIRINILIKKLAVFGCVKGISNNRFAQFNIVDLAGRINDSLNLSKKEEFHINMSLSILNLIIIQLNDLSNVNKCINYKESKLIHCLKLAFGGNSHTAFICTISPASMKETLTTLWFASRVAKVKNTMKLNLTQDYIFKISEKMDSFVTLLINSTVSAQQTFTSEGMKNKIREFVSTTSDEITSVMTKTFKYYLDKLSLNLTLPFVKSSDIMPAFYTLKEDILKFNNDLQTLFTYLKNENEDDLMDLFQTIEYDIENLRPRLKLTKILLKIFDED